MEVSQVIQQKLTELGLDQRDLAAAGEVTESYISQLLNRKKMPPAPERTDLYSKLEAFLKLPPGQLASLADLQRKQELKKKIQRPLPLYEDVRTLLVRKCKRSKRRQVAAIFDKEPFGELEYLVTRKVLDVVKALARQELEHERWLRDVARESGRGYRRMRAAILELLEMEVSNITPESCIAFLDPMIASWDIDLTSFALDITLNRGLAQAHTKRFEFVESDTGKAERVERGLQQFLKDRSLSGDASSEELQFLKDLCFLGDRRPTALYYYRALQNLRDPLHFRD